MSYGASSFSSRESKVRSVLRKTKLPRSRVGVKFAESARNAAPWSGRSPASPARKAVRSPLPCGGPGEGDSWLARGNRSRARQRHGEPEVDAERGAAAGLALDRNDETMFVGDALHHGEPDPGALRARREERVEELLALPLVDARPMTGDGELHALVRVQDDANHHFLAGPTRLYGIPHQVPDELAELSAVRANTDGGFPRVAHGHVGDGPPR